MLDEEAGKRVSALQCLQHAFRGGAAREPGRGNELQLVVENLADALRRGEEEAVSDALGGRLLDLSKL